MSQSSNNTAVGSAPQERHAISSMLDKLLSAVGAA
jgi:hypothetical protein